MEHGTFPDTGLPISEILVLAGFLFIYTLEELMHMVLVCTAHRQFFKGKESFLMINRDKQFILL